MNRERFEQIVAAYGADPRRWPEAERAAAEAFAAENPDAAVLTVGEAGLDRMLDHAAALPDTSALAARILAQTQARAGRAFDTRALVALAACAVFGVIIGYSGGQFAPVSDVDDYYFSAAFEAPLFDGDEG